MRGTSTFQPDANGPTLTVDYPSPTTLTREFAPHFRRDALRGLGLWLPPSAAFGMIERRPRLLNKLTTLEDRLSGNQVSAWLADHYWIELARTDSVA